MYFVGAFCLQSGDCILLRTIRQGFKKAAPHRMPSSEKDTTANGGEQEKGRKEIVVLEPFIPFCHTEPAEV